MFSDDNLQPLLNFIEFLYIWITVNQTPSVPTKGDIFFSGKYSTFQLFDVTQFRF